MPKDQLVRDLIDWDYADEQTARRDIDAYRIIDAYDRVCIYKITSTGLSNCIAWAKMSFDGWWEITESSPRRNLRHDHAETIEKVITIIKKWEDS